MSTHLISILTLAALIVPASRDAEPQASAPGPDYEALARTIVTDMASGRFDAVAARFTPQMAAALPGSRLADTWAALTSRAGAFKSIQSVSVSETHGYHAVVVVCAFERTTLGLRAVLSGEGQFAGLNVVPATPPAEWTAPDYAHPYSFEEHAITVGKAPLELTATLTVPKGSGPFPAVVLVQGSGPHDQDETIGPNKPFKDLAWGLASRGIVVLRYNKRTFQYPESFKGRQFTVEDETIEDAKAAVDELGRRAGIDSNRIYVVGHSLGAMLAPRIAKEDTEVAGIVMMAANFRPLEDLVVEQVKYQVSLAGPLTPQGEQQIAAAEKTAADMRNPELTAGQTVDFLGIPLPGSYVLDLRAYSQARTAAGLKIPILVLQGARDCQVRMADFDGWKKALAGDSLATFHRYPNLYHLFLPVPPSDKSALSTPADYEVPGHVASDVVADIAAWINAQREPSAARKP
jgi:uncharacterized protein